MNYIPSSPGAKYHLLPNRIDPNDILDIESSMSVGRFRQRSYWATRLELIYNFRGWTEIDSRSYHVCRVDFREVKLVVEICKMRINCVSRHNVRICFYITKVKGCMIFGIR